jgi:hypothetical protein
MVHGEAAYRHFLETAFRFLESSVHGAHNRAVLELGKAEIQRGHKARIVRHGARFERSPAVPPNGSFLSPSQIITHKAHALPNFAPTLSFWSFAAARRGRQQRFAPSGKMDTTNW